MLINNVPSCALTAGSPKPSNRQLLVLHTYLHQNLAAILNLSPQVRYTVIRATVGTFYHVSCVVSASLVCFTSLLCTEEQLKADIQQAKEHIQSESNPQVGTVSTGVRI